MWTTVKHETGISNLMSQDDTTDDEPDFDEYPVGDYDQMEICSELADEHRQLKERVEKAKERLGSAMQELPHAYPNSEQVNKRITFENHLRHAHAALGGVERELYMESERIACTPNSELRELVEQWREDGIPIHPQNPDVTSSAGHKAAKELEAIIDD